MIEDETARQTAARILAWYEAMGVDAALGDGPVDWLERPGVPPGAQFSLQPAATTAPPLPNRASPAPAAAPARSLRPPASATVTPPARQFPGRAPAPAADAAAAEAARAGSLAELRGMLERFEGCGLKATAKNLCLYRGAERSPLMIIGEAPGRDEDLEGKPFVGRAGQLLDRMLAAIGMSDADVHITNIVYWRPPGNRTPTPQEALACRPFLERQLALVAPKVVLALGGAAAKELFAVSEGIMRLRGKWRPLEMGGQTVQAMATLHPAYLLRTPAAKGMAWRDLLAVKAALKAQA